MTASIEKVNQIRPWPTSFTEYPTSASNMMDGSKEDGVIRAGRPIPHAKVLNKDCRVIAI
jgi:hypothetical protein